MCQIFSKSQSVNSFWIKESSNYKQSSTIIPSITRSIPAKQTSTKEQRFASLMSTFKIAAELASVSISATDSTTTEVNGIIAKLQLSKREGVKATKNSGDMRKSNTELVELVSGTEFIANPPVKKKQSQSRKQPHAIGAPTTSSHKAASARSNRERKETERVKAAKALGMM
jgi:hypothetical protein